LLDDARESRVAEQQRQADELAELKQALAERDARIAELEKELKATKGRLRGLEDRERERERQTVEATADVSASVTTKPELEQTLARFMKRVAMIMQAEKCVFMLHDRETGELYAHPPALGIPPEQLSMLRVRATQGVSG